MRRPFLRILLGWLLLAAGTAWACRYSVRDTGFVDLGTETYRLEFSGADPLATIYRQTAAGLLVDANIGFFPAEPGPDAVPALTLRDGTGRRLELASGFDLPAVPAEVSRRVESVVTSPAREEILRESLRSFAVVVLVEGTDADATARAVAAAERAVAAVARLQPAMPKPVDLPAHLLRLPLDRQASERILLWGLGLDPAPAADPRAAIVYGRGRRLGSPLEGALITRTALQERLTLIGQDCECDLDRAWMQGPVLPGRWDVGLQQMAANTLGFDPENPMVRTEVGRIVLRGEGDRQRQRPTGSALALGYTEEPLDLGDAPGDDIDAGIDPSLPPGSLEDPAATASETPATAAAAPSDRQPREPAVAEGSPVTLAWWTVGGVLGTALLVGAWLLLRGGGRG